MPGTPRANLRYAAYRSTLRMRPCVPARVRVGTAAEREGRLTLLVWIAPAEHYYDRDAEAVSRLFDSLRFVE